MHFVVQCPESAPIERFPWFGRSVVETSLGAAEALGAETTLAIGAAAGPSAEAAASRLRALPEDAHGVLLPTGLLAPPAVELGQLARQAVAAPKWLENEGGDVIAVGGVAAVLADALRSTFDEAVAAVADRGFPGGVVADCERIRDARTWQKTLRAARKKTAARFLEAGALVECPDTLWADPTCEAEPGARIGACVRLTGATKLAAGAEVGSFSHLADTELAPGAVVLGHSVITGSVLGRGARVGPFAHIRPGTRLLEESFAGAFTETKNAVLGRRSALPHLSYLGDSEVGTRVNLGAGTVTCNYDGRNKHRTVIGSGAFVGSNAILVAPVTIGRRAFVAAGSVIVDDVPAGALAIARGRQAVKTDRAAGRFEGADEV